MEIRGGCSNACRSIPHCTALHCTALDASDAQLQWNATVHQFEDKQHLTINTQRVNEGIGRLSKRMSERLVRVGVCETAAGASQMYRQCNATVRQSKEKHHHSIQNHRVN